MRRSNRWKRLLALGLAAMSCLPALTGCAGTAAEPGLALSVCVGTVPVTLDPIYAEEASDQTILLHLYENLMRVRTDNAGGTVVENGMAKSVDMEEKYDGTVTYTFRLRSAKWSDGRPVKAEDFVYAWRRLADPASQSPYASLLSIVTGYDAARASGDLSQLAVAAKNDNTLVVELSGHYDWFLTGVCTSPATLPLREDVLSTLKAAAEARRAEGGGEPARWWSDPTALVTNGPFTAAEETADALCLSASDGYPGGVGLGSLTFRFADSAQAAWELYNAKEVDAVWPLPEEQLTELAADQGWSPAPVLSSYGILFNCAQLPDGQVRRAMSMAVDREALSALAGPLAGSAEGLVPPGVPEGDGAFRSESSILINSDPGAYDALCAQAGELLAAAGYDSGVYLGELEYLYEDTERNAQVAAALCGMWREKLGIRVTPRGVTEQELWSALRSGSYVLAGAELSAACNDAECFLMKYTSHSGDNVLRYESTAYDTLMSVIASAADGSARMGCLHDAEDLLVNIDCALTPLYTRGTAWKLRSSLTGLCRDVRGWFIFTGVTEAAGIPLA